MHEQEETPRHVDGLVQAVVPQIRHTYTVNRNVPFRMNIAVDFDLPQFGNVVNYREDHYANNVDPSSAVRAERTRPQRVTHRYEPIERYSYSHISRRGMTSGR